MSSGIIDSLRAFAESLLATLQDRVALVSLELREEKLRQVRILAWTCVVIFTALMACTFASLTLVCLFWDHDRTTALVGLTLFYSGAAVGMVIAFRRFLARQPRPFDATLQELAQDRACLHPKT